MNQTLAKTTWQPTATIEKLKQRAAFLAQIRQFFAKRDVWEVDVPLMCHASITGIQLHTIRCEYMAADGALTTRYLQTSPEFAMKRLIAAGSGAIYYLGKAFRDEPTSRKHNPEFTMLEWYRPHFSYEALMDELAELLSELLNVSTIEKVTYVEVFQKYLSIDPLTTPTETLRARAKQLPGCEQVVELLFERDDILDLLLTHGIEKHLGDNKLTFLHLYPASQAALAKISAHDSRVAERFEVYYRGVELANGFGELADAKEQRSRFEQENRERIERGLPAIPIDEYLLAALEAGFPECAGVAVGMDRVLMLAVNCVSLSEVMAFPADRA